MRIFTCCVAVLHAVKIQVSVLFIDSILLLQGQTSQDRVTGKKQTFMENRAGLLEFAGIHSELHISLNLY